MIESEPEAESDAETDPIETLRTADERVETLRSEFGDDVHPTEIDDLVESYRSVTSILDHWEDRATDWDDFQGYVEFRNNLAETLDSIPEDTPKREAFIDADSHVKTSGVSKSLDGSDFDAARSALAPVRSLVETYEALEDAREKRRRAYRRAERRAETHRERIASLERLLERADGDFDAPTERLREPISAYNEAIEEEFNMFRRERSAREFLSFVRRAAQTPLVGYELPPQELLQYVGSKQAGDRSVGELLEYSEYSNSKLSHYVDDPGLLKRRIATNRTYLERLSADPLSIEWPPRSADLVWFRTGELIPLVGRFADESTVATLREIRSLTRDPAYEQLRTAAKTDAELTDEERRQIENGEVEPELSAARADLKRLEDALNEYDP